MKSTLTPMALFLAGVVTSHAAVIASDSFSYTDGGLAGNNGGSGWASGWTDAQGTPTVASGAVNLSSTSNQQAVRTLSAAQSGDAVIWIRFEAQQTTTLSGTTSTFGGFGLYNGATEQLLVGKSWPGAYEWKAGTGGTMVAPAASVSTLNLTTVLARVTLNSAGNDVLDVWLNPVDMSSEGALGAAQINRTDADLNFDTIRLRSGSGAGGTETWQFDNLTLGTSLGDVTTVPEPSMMLLGGLGVLGLLRRRRTA